MMKLDRHRNCRTTRTVYSTIYYTVVMLTHAKWKINLFQFFLSFSVHTLVVSCSTSIDDSLSSFLKYLQYIGCLEVNTSMKSLDFDTRSQIAKWVFFRIVDIYFLHFFLLIDSFISRFDFRECINIVCETAGLKTVDKKRKVSFWPIHLIFFFYLNVCDMPVVAPPLCV